MRRIKRNTDKVYKCSMPFYDTVLEYTIIAQSASKARYRFFHEHLSETSLYQECFKFIKVKSLGKHMSQPTRQDQLRLVKELNERYAVGDSIRVTMDDDTVVTWTVRAPASMLGASSSHIGHTAVIWCEEHNSCYAADRVIV